MTTSGGTNQEILSELARIKAVFQLRTIEMVIHGSAVPPAEPEKPHPQHNGEA